MSTILPVLRRSAIQTAKSCLYRYDQIWNRHVSDMSDVALRGIAFHAAAHRYIIRLRERNLPQDAEEAELAFTEGIAAALTPAHLVREVRELFDLWAEHFELELNDFVAAEEHQRTGEDFTFTPDLVYARQTELEIIDFKTFWTPLTEVQARNDWQARWYSFNAMKIWPHFPRYRFSFFFVRYGSFTSVVFTPDDLSTFTREVAAVAATIEEAHRRDEWPATPGQECAYCQLQCPAVDNQLILPKRIQGITQAQQIAAFILAGENMLRTAKKALKAYCATNGAVDVRGVVFDNRRADSVSYPFPVVAESIQALPKDQTVNVPVGSDVTISRSSLKGAFKAHPQLERLLAPSAIVKPSFRFGAKKPGTNGDVEEEE